VLRNVDFRFFGTSSGQSRIGRAAFAANAQPALHQAGAILIYVKRTVGLEYILTRMIEAKIALTSQ
jgi:hypothetical protein